MGCHEESMVGGETQATVSIVTMDLSGTKNDCSSFTCKVRSAALHPAIASTETFPNFHGGNIQSIAMTLKEFKIHEVLGDH